MLFNVRDLQATLRVSRRYVYDLVEDGEIAHTRIGNRIRFTQEQIDAYLDAHAVPSRTDSGDTPADFRYTRSPLIQATQP